MAKKYIPTTSETLEEVKEDFSIMLENFTEFHPGPILGQVLHLTVQAIFECAPNKEAALQLIDIVLSKKTEKEDS